MQGQQAVRMRRNDLIDVRQGLSTKPRPRRVSAAEDAEHADNGHL